jgi:molybdopterin synthase catalytic subunit
MSDDPESLRRRIVAACDIVPPITFTAEELGAVVAVFEGIVRDRESQTANVVSLFFPPGPKGRRHSSRTAAR